MNEPIDYRPYLVGIAFILMLIEIIIVIKW